MVKTFIAALVVFLVTGCAPVVPLHPQPVDPVGFRKLPGTVTLCRNMVPDWETTSNYGGLLGHPAFSDSILPLLRASFERVVVTENTNEALSGYATPCSGQGLIVSPYVDYDKMVVVFGFGHGGYADTIWTFSHPIANPANSIYFSSANVPYYDSELGSAVREFRVAFKERQPWLARYPAHYAEALKLEAAGDRAVAAGDKAGAFTDYLQALDGLAIGTEAHTRILDKFAPVIPFGTPPPLPDEARRWMTIGHARFKQAKDITGIRSAIDAFARAVEAAPWWPATYFNTAVAYEEASRAVGPSFARYWAPSAVTWYKRYLAAAPDAKDAQAVKEKLWTLEANPQ